jgi:hypothetical protein
MCIDELEIENLVPEHLRDLATLDEFARELHTCDEMYHRRLHEAKKTNHVLCYVGRISPFQGCTIGLKE